MAPEISVILPAYNEESCLEQSLDALDRYLASRGHGYEIVLVDDGSTDRTLAIARKMAERLGSFTVLTEDANHGKGYVVRRGMLAAHGAYRLFCDADLSIPVHQLDKLLHEMERGFEIAIGSRYLNPDTPRHTVWYRRLMGSVYNLCVRHLTSLRFRDTQCGFKCFSARAAETIFGQLTLTGFSFDVEVLWLAQQLGLPVVEVPVDWWSQRETKVRALRDPLRMFRDLFYLRRRGARLRQAGGLVSSAQAASTLEHPES